MDLRIQETIDFTLLNQLFESVGWTGRSEDSWRRVFEVSSFWVSVWESEQLVGFGRILEDSDFAFILDVLVHKEHQAQGIGSMIIERIVEEVQHKNYFQIALFAGMEGRNEHLISLYEKFGFERVENGMELKKYQSR